MSKQDQARRKMLQKRIKAMPYSDVEAIRNLPVPRSDAQDLKEVLEVLRKEAAAKLH